MTGDLFNRLLVVPQTAQHRLACLVPTDFHRPGLPMNSSDPPAKSRLRRIAESRPFRYVVVAIVVLFVADRVNEHVQSQAIRERLTGRWICEFPLEDGSVATQSVVFRPDGLLRIYRLGRPETERENIAGDMEWTVTGGELILTYQRHFPRNGTILRQARRLWSLIRSRMRGNYYPVVNSERCVIDDPGGSTVTIRSHPDTLPGHSWVGQNWKLTRAEDKTVGDLQSLKHLAN